MRTVSLGAMIKQIAALAGTGDVGEWEDRFIADIDGYTNNGETTQGISEKQIAVIERIWRKHFA